MPKPDMRLMEIETPFLLLDLDAFERNVKRLADWCAAHDVALRPHAKTHKSVDIAKIQMAHGAIGLSCQKVAEAEILVAGGIENVMVTNQVIGHAKCARLATLAEKAQIAVCVDSAQGIADLSEAAAAANTMIDVLVEIDVGGGRCGVPPGEPAVLLAEQIGSATNLTFAGLQAYNGSAQHLRAHAERAQAFSHVERETTRTRDMLAKTGFPCRIIGGAGTGSYLFEGATDLWTELQCGSYIFMDADYARNRAEDGTPKSDFEHALFVVASVMSRASDDHAVLDAGHKAAAIDSGLPQPWALPGVSYNRPSDEHGVLKAEPGYSVPDLGTQVLLVPGHCDPTVNLHDRYVGVRDLDTDGGRAKVEVVWPVSARGALT